MPALPTNALLDLPPYPANGYARLADRLARILKTRNDVLFVQAEAIVALEATAASVGSKSIDALNVVTSPYGRWFGEWLRRAGAAVTDVVAEPGMPISVQEVADALDARPGVNLVALVHAESASGILNPLEDILALARHRGALTIVDAVASVGGHALDVDALGIDIAVIGPQKSLGGPAGLSALSVSQRAWQAIDRADAPVRSVLSLIDLKRDWLDAGRRALPGMPSALEFHALEAALDRVETEGLDIVIERHALAAQATRDGLRAVGVEPWIEDAKASNLVTAVAPPHRLSVANILASASATGAGLSEGPGDLAKALVRLNHTGPRANRSVVLQSLVAFGDALKSLGHPADIEAARHAVERHYKPHD